MNAYVNIIKAMYEKENDEKRSAILFECYEKLLEVWKEEKHNDLQKASDAFDRLIKDLQNGK